MVDWGCFRPYYVFMSTEITIPEALDSVNLPTGITRARVGIDWRSVVELRSKTHDLAVCWETAGVDSGWVYTLRSASDYRSGRLDSVAELNNLFERML